MGMKATVKDIVTPLWRINPETGYYETVEFVGSLRLRPKGWKIGNAPWGWKKGITLPL